MSLVKTSDFGSKLEYFKKFNTMEKKFDEVSTVKFIMDAHLIILTIQLILITQKVPVLSLIILWNLIPKLAPTVIGRLVTHQVVF